MQLGFPGMEPSSWACHVFSCFLPFLSLCRDVRRAGVFGALLVPPASILPVHVDSSWRSIDVSVASRAAWPAQHSEVGHSNGTCPLLSLADPG